MIMFRLLPVLFPDIWGLPNEKMAVLGFGRDPFEPGTVMPLGTGYSLSLGFDIPDVTHNTRINYATLTCMACHTGAVTGHNGTLLRLIGPPNQIGNFFRVGRDVSPAAGPCPGGAGPRHQCPSLIKHHIRILWRG